MSLTLLLDLDDTLLQNDIDVFLPHYLKALSVHLSDRFDGEELVRKLLAATRQMVHNTNPRFTAEEAFDQSFYPALNTTKEDLSTALLGFYSQVFPTLQWLTQPKPAAQDLVKAAFDRGYQVVIATNPLFPTTAIHQRLEWAGLSPRNYPFTLITTYENMHFTKPSIAYYAEILGQLGWPDQPAVMVGNSLSDDIQPAAALGLPTYYLTATPARENGDGRMNAHGALDGVLPWLAEVEDAQHNVPVIRTPAALLGVLRSTPAAFDSITRGYHSRDDWSYRPAAGEWSATEIACHLRDVDAEVNLPRYERITRGENPFLPGVNSDLWANERGYAQRDGSAALREFMQARQDILRLLEALDESGWNQPARHAIFGPTTLLELVSFTTTHDRNHLQQLWCNPLV